MKNKVCTKDVQWFVDFQHQINTTSLMSLDLSDFFEGDLTSVIEAFEMTGLNNMDFILSNFADTHGIKRVWFLSKTTNTQPKEEEHENTNR